MEILQYKEGYLEFIRQKIIKKEYTIGVNDVFVRAVMTLCGGSMHSIADLDNFNEGIESEVDQLCKNISKYMLREYTIELKYVDTELMYEKGTYQRVDGFELSQV